MFFYLSKIFWFTFQPFNFLAILMGFGLLFFKYSLGRKILVGAVSLFLFLAIFPVGHNLMVYLENMYPTPNVLPKKVDGIIVLGGSVETYLTFAHGQAQINENGERLVEMVRLGHAYPDAKLVFTGGDASLDQSSGKESIVVHSLLESLGFDDSKVIYESDSRNTYENMTHSMKLAKPLPDETWILVTSAFHMPRSAAIFNSNGWKVIPYSSGYIADATYRYLPSHDLLGNYYKLQVAVREIIGIIAYTLTERIKSDEAYSDREDVTLHFQSYSDELAFYRRIGGEL